MDRFYNFSGHWRGYNEEPHVDIDHCLTAGDLEAEQLKSGAYYITQSWSQETAFKRPYYVSVPERPGQQKLPAFIFLHGNGGNAKGAMNAFTRRHTRWRTATSWCLPTDTRRVGT